MASTNDDQLPMQDVYGNLNTLDECVESDNERDQLFLSLDSRSMSPAAPQTIHPVDIPLPVKSLSKVRVPPLNFAMVAPGVYRSGYVSF